MSVAGGLCEAPRDFLARCSPPSSRNAAVSCFGAAWVCIQELYCIPYRTSTCACARMRASTLRSTRASHLRSHRWVLKDRFALQSGRRVPPTTTFRARERACRFYVGNPACYLCEHNTAPGEAIRQRVISGKQRPAHSQDRQRATPTRRRVTASLLLSSQVRGSTLRKQKRALSG